MSSENELKIALIQSIKSGLTLLGITAQVAQSYQPFQTGAEIQPTIYIHKIGDTRYGFNGRTNKWDRDNEIMVHKNSQRMETTFQINALTKTDMTNPEQLTVTDLLNAAADILAMDQTRAFLKPKKIGILRITDVTNPFFVDSLDQNESSPSFDVTFTHQNVRTTTSPVIETEEFEIYRV